LNYFFFGFKLPCREPGPNLDLRLKKPLVALSPTPDDLDDGFWGGCIITKHRTDAGAEKTDHRAAWRTMRRRSRVPQALSQVGLLVERFSSRKGRAPQIQNCAVEHVSIGCPPSQHLVANAVGFGKQFEFP
jgi:hypothetical protein